VVQKADSDFHSVWVWWWLGLGYSQIKESKQFFFSNFPPKFLFFPCRSIESRNSHSRLCNLRSPISGATNIISRVDLRVWGHYIRGWWAVRFAFTKP
jgi:hypothetical protein